jgi:hypothetical protein
MGKVPDLAFAVNITIVNARLRLQGRWSAYDGLVTASGAPGKEQCPSTIADLAKSSQKDIAMTEWLSKTCGHNVNPRKEVDNGHVR